MTNIFEEIKTTGNSNFLFLGYDSPTFSSIFVPAFLEAPPLADSGPRCFLAAESDLELVASLLLAGIQGDFRCHDEEG